MVYARAMSGIGTRNIHILYAATACKWFFVALAFLYPYYQGFGLSLADFFLIQAVFAVAIVVFEFPTGYIGDRMGHHRSIQLGLFFSALGWWGLYMSDSLWGFLLAEVVMGLGVSLVSGSDSALLYESAKVSDASYTKVENKVHSIQSFAEGFGALVGTVLVVWGTPFVIFMQACIVSLALPLALLLRPIVGVTKSEVRMLADMLRIVRFATGHRELRALILLTAAVGTATLSAVWFIQPYLTLTNVPLWMYGIVWASQSFILGICSLFVERFEKWVGDRATLVLLATLPIYTYIALAFVPVGGVMVVLFVVFFFVRALMHSYSKVRIQQLALGEWRASIGSLSGLTFRLLFAVVGTSVGLVGTYVSLPAAFIATAVATGLLVWHPVRVLYRNGSRNS